ncbi:hypothetical protein [Lactococcus termiticola]|uniref:Uncharacterized protein n=1 Tax=Lactococcus termiticola TaxID=2169526 RepID=A0A2R5HFB6_9LACT|nr:hypothetical protein [Lactococcus termiticola]GBG96722.1 hypothetical protein NtB2_00846 [Lactococcus termiticola]
MDIRKEFSNALTAFEPIFNDTFGQQRQAEQEDVEIIKILSEQEDTAEKEDVIANIDNLEKVYDVVQFQTEMMVEYVRATVGSIAARFDDEATQDDERLQMLLFVHEKMVKLHNQLDFFFSSFEEEDLKKGFSIARRSVTAMAFKKNTEKDQMIAFVRELRSNTMKYLTIVNNIHDWLHSILDMLDKENAPA